MNLRVSLTMLAAAFFLGAVAQAKDILVIGDSQTCGTFGKYLFQGLNKNGNTVTVFCTPSSNPVHWMTQTNPGKMGTYLCRTMSSNDPVLRDYHWAGLMPSLKSLLSQHKKAQVIVAMGTNSLLDQHLSSSYLDMVKTIRANGNSCDWIGPPHLNASQAGKSFTPKRVTSEESNLDSFYTTLSAKLEGHCNVIDSRSATAVGTAGYDTADGVHRSDKGGKAWAAGVLSLLGKPVIQTPPTPFPESARPADTMR